tara:strand:+ start:494 stop:1018 length:525 start_codon:yes stop_codon:yes gene_type:complete
MIKVISGIYKNRKLKYFNYSNIRPTQSRVKKSMFDSLYEINNNQVLDLFSGVGSLGIEAYSRGANSVTFVDNNLKAINILKKNLELLSLFEKSSIINKDVLSFLNKNNKKYDLILADPPYNKFSFYDLMPFIKNSLNKNGIFCYETSKKETILDFDVKIKKIGDTQLIFWRNYE